MIAGIIPSRYASSRFPGKPLINLNGKTMIQRVYEQALASRCLHTVVVATDDKRIFDHVQSFGGNVVMTSANHPSGTDRCREALHHLKVQYRYVINIQGDEPLINPVQIDELTVLLNDESIELATQMIKVKTYEELIDRKEVKIVLNTKNEALYFSRQPIPFIKDVEESQWHLHHSCYRQVGMYAYRNDILDKITKLPVSSLEQAESLEQLRWIENGFTVKCIITEFESICIDTPEDAERVRKLLQKSRR
jgi:3-deoxy-manno-octulosonate cytidylyltransferase (CMP-KDO synthetase)